MSNTGTGPPLIERADVHKSCKAIETVINLLNDYCEATSALCLVQKKLYKALREATSLKGSPEVSVNALSCTSSLFESLSEVDSKFSKLVDKECESISSDVRKWFKKLSKEEKAHDERLMNANAKIKTASQTYEKAAKKKNSTAMEEHTRYMNLISAIGPEISEDKYNHTLFVTRQHIHTLMAVSACLTRVADAEWTRHCESVRRCGSIIGSVTQWKAYCEAEWRGAVPNDLLDMDVEQAGDGGNIVTSREGSGETRDSEHIQQQNPMQSLDATTTSPTSPPYTRPHRISPLPSPGPSFSAVPPSSYSSAPSKESEFDPQSTKFTGSGPGFGTLTSSFPTPPTHTPVQLPSHRRSSIAAVNMHSGTIESGDAVIREHAKDAKQPSGGDVSTSPIGSGSRVAAIRDRWDRHGSTPTSPTSGVRDKERERDREAPSRQTSVHVADLASLYDSPASQDESRAPLQSSRSPPPRDQSSTPFPATLDLSSPTPTPLHNNSNVLGLSGPLTSEPGHVKSASPLERDRMPDDDPTVRARRRRIQELQTLQFEEQEYMLNEQQRVIQERAIDLEREKERLRIGKQQIGRNEGASGSTTSFEGDATRVPKTKPYKMPSYSVSFTQFPSATSTMPLNPSSESSSATKAKLIAPRKPRLSLSGSASSTSLVPLPSSATPGHPFNCTCLTCVLNRPPDVINPVHLREPKPEKPKGWIRRLSMPVGAAFSLNDSSKKRSSSNLHGTYYGAGAGVGPRDLARMPGYSAPTEDGRMSMDQRSGPVRR